MWTSIQQYHIDIPSVLLPFFVAMITNKENTVKNCSFVLLLWEIRKLFAAAAGTAAEDLKQAAVA